MSDDVAVSVGASEAVEMFGSGSVRCLVRLVFQSE